MKIQIFVSSVFDLINEYDMGNTAATDLHFQMGLDISAFADVHWTSRKMDISR